MPEKDAIRLLKSRYIIEDLGMNQLEYEPRKKVDDFDWSYYQPLVEVRKHLGSQWKQKLDEKFKWEIIQLEDDEDDYIDAEPKLEERQPAAPAQVIETQNIQQQNNIENQQNNYIININIPILQIYGDGDEDSSKGFACLSRFSFDKITATLGHQPKAEQLIITTIGLLAHMSWNNYYPKMTNGKLEEITNSMWREKTMRSKSILKILQELNIISINNKKQCMINPAYGFAVTRNNQYLQALEMAYDEFKETGVFNMPFKNVNKKPVLTDYYKEKLPELRS